MCRHAPMLVGWRWSHSHSNGAGFATELFRLERRIFGQTHARRPRETSRSHLVAPAMRTRTHKRPFGQVTVRKRYTDLYTLAWPPLYKSNANFCPGPRVVAVNEIDFCQFWLLARLKDSVVIVFLVSITTNV
jgi:hypothetical protein